MRKKTLLKLVVSFTLVLSLAIPMNIAVFAGGDEVEGAGACTSFYMGKGTTENGAYIWGRTEDDSATARKLFIVHEAETHAPGDLFKSNSPSSSFTWPYPEQTLRYIACPGSIYNGGNFPEPYGEIGMNEMNVAVSATVTLSGTKTQITGTGGIDRMVSGGLDENDTAAVVLMQAKTAREGIELLAKVVDEKGAAGREGTMIGDPNEVWYFQIVSGHQYVGVKCPDDMIGFSPNITGNVGLDNYVDITDTENFVVSPGLVSVAQAAETYVGNAEGTKIKVADSYASAASNHQAGRLRVGYGYLYGYATNAEIAANLPGTQYLNYFVAPRQDRKYSLYEALRLLACRGEGTEWFAVGTSNSTTIGNENTQEAHVVETRPWMPPELASVEWQAMGPAEFSVYLPYMGSLITEVYEKHYFYDQQNYDLNDPYNNTYWHVFRTLHNLCARGVTNTSVAASEAIKIRNGQGVKDFWEVYQKSLIEQQAKVDAYLLKVLEEQGREAAEQAATELSVKLTADTYEYAVQMIAELRAFSVNPVGNYVPSFSAIPAYAPDTLVFLNLSTDAVTYISGDAEYTLSVSNAKDVLAVELEFTMDGSQLSGKGLVGLNGFDAMNGILWTYAGDNLWKGSVTLAFPSGSTSGLTSEAPVDIAKFVYSPKGFGNASMTVTSARVVGLYDDTTRYLIPIIENGTATTVVAKSKYDLNRDGVVDALDLGIMLLYCGFDADSADWGTLVKVNDAWGNGVTASMCDVNDDDLIDMLDLLDLFIHYTK